MPMGPKQEYTGIKVMTLDKVTSLFCPAWGGGGGGVGGCLNGRLKKL